MLAPEGPQRSVPAVFVPTLLRRIDDGVGFPEDLSGFRIDRGERAARLAAGILGIGRQDVLDHRDRNVEPSVVQLWCAGDHRRDLIVHHRLPERRATRGVECVEPGALVAEEHRRASILQPAHARRRAHRRFRGVAPMDASRARVQRVDLATGAAHEYAPAGDGRSAVREDRSREAKGPAHLQPAQIRRREPGLRLETCVLRAGAPAGPLRSVEREGGRARAASARGRGASAEVLPGGIDRHRPLLRERQPHGLRQHRSALKRTEDRFRRHQPQCFAPGRPRHVLVVAHRAALCVERFAGHLCAGGSGLSGDETGGCNRHAEPRQGERHWLNLRVRRFYARWLSSRHPGIRFVASALRRKAACGGP